jgi:hypothetical protein
MKCNHPPPLTPDQLSDAIDGKADAAILAHLSDCPFCEQRLAMAQQAEEGLSSRLFRWDCPTSQQIGDYDQGLLAEAESASVASHIRQCARCTQELAELRLFMATADRPPAEAPKPAAIRRPSLSEVIAQLLPRSLAPALRGDTPPPLMAKAEGVTILLDVQPAEGDQLAIQGQLAAENQDDWTDALITVRQAGVLKATAAVDDLGGFSVAGLPAGPTEFRITPQTGRPVLLKDVMLTA